MRRHPEAARAGERRVRDELLARYDEQMRRGARADSPRARIERSARIVRQIGTADDWNAVLWSRLDPATADAAVAEQIRDFTALGLDGFEWKLYAHDRPGDLAERLLAAGFRPEPTETLMVAETAVIARGGGPPGGDVAGAPAAPEIRLRRVVDAAGVELVVRVHEQAFGVGATERSRIGQRLLSQLSGAPDTVAAVVALAGDVPVSAARMELHPGTDFAGLWGGGTVPEWRGRGLYRALVTFRARVAAERGYRLLQVDASDQSTPILRRLGFTPLGSTTPYVHHRSRTTAD
ncbi:GNAT family N-acetyltransferase [Streptomyces lycii]|uniref:GNAT family N-acetyltransferase n=1 Tax=Streptomyces lycii TaxID=2654337 RepID=A0ABQ7FH22_9ACTN|nr:GNAT family N-acetyltransferase [Streptomyces lycii]KAF4407136.1 GNAT family N-acetyltransferase [Streptomyces lycii]